MEGGCPQPQLSASGGCGRPLRYWPHFIIMLRWRLALTTLIVGVLLAGCDSEPAPPAADTAVAPAPTVATVAAPQPTEPPPTERATTAPAPTAPPPPTETATAVPPPTEPPTRGAAGLIHAGPGRADGRAAD